VRDPLRYSQPTKKEEKARTAFPPVRSLGALCASVGIAPSRADLNYANELIRIDKQLR
jgi:hypothetical protein